VLTQVEVESFQSLRKLSLRLGRLTVVTGPTGSGKSAVLRAIRLLAFNARGTSYITRGAKFCAVQAAAEGETLMHCAIDRHLTRGKDAYLLRQMVPTPVRDGMRETGARFTKLGGEVPEQVQAALQLSELNFAAQFDRPFLLDSSGGEIARVLGRLTNVTLLFDAAREAERRRREIMGDLRRAEASLAGLTEAAQRFRGMHERRAAVCEAEEALERAHQAAVRAGRLEVLTDRPEAAQEALERSRPPEVPSAEKLDELAGKLVRMQELYLALAAGKSSAEEAYVRSMRAVQDEEAAHGRLHEVLVEAGQCPTCGSRISLPIARA
jgi:DNA repair protein SbcC/Rad50